jgi:hypothetical protein
VVFYLKQGFIFMYIKAIVLGLILLTSAQHPLLSANDQVTDSIEQESELFTVKDVKRTSDLDNDRYFFAVRLNNGHSFEVSATLEDVLNEKIYSGQYFQLVSEDFVAEDPGRSAFVYKSTDGTTELKGIFRSIRSHWHPSGSEKIVTITKKDGYRNMGNSYNLVYFSDGSRVNNRSMYLEGSQIGDEYFQLKPPERNRTYVDMVEPRLLVGKKDGRVIRGYTDSERFITKNW